MIIGEKIVKRIVLIINRITANINNNITGLKSKLDIVISPQTFQHSSIKHIKTTSIAIIKMSIISITTNAKTQPIILYNKVINKKSNTQTNILYAIKIKYNGKIGLNNPHTITIKKSNINLINNLINNENGLILSTKKLSNGLFNRLSIVKLEVFLKITKITSKIANKTAIQLSITVFLCLVIKSLILSLIW